jgi:hypothetical protein
VTRFGAGLVLGYCEKRIAERVVGGEALTPSDKPYDWLGPGVYFWEDDHQRALEWATQRTGARALKEPAVVGAVIDLGNCLDLTTREGVDTITLYFHYFEEAQRAAGEPMPRNENLAGDGAGDRLLRFLDRAVIAFMHETIARQVESERAEGLEPTVRQFDSVRGLFPEGEPAYPGAGFLTKTHTQIAVYAPDSILGVFRPRSRLVTA